MPASEVPAIKKGAKPGGRFRLVPQADRRQSHKGQDHQGSYQSVVHEMSFVVENSFMDVLSHGNERDY